MNAWFRGSLVLVSSLMASCALESGDAIEAGGVAPSQGATEAPLAPQPVDSAEATEEDGSAMEQGPDMPSRVFESIDALCRAQEVLVAKQLNAAEQRRREFEVDFTLKPSCKVAPQALAYAKITLGGRFLEVSAVSANLVQGTGTFLVVRTTGGWRALPRASAVDHYSDPGCFSIERDGGITQVNVLGTEEAPALVVLGTTYRGDHIENGESDGPRQMVMWDEIKTSASACRLGVQGFTCDAQQTLRLELVPNNFDSGRKSTLRFATSYRVDDAGALHTEATYSNEQSDE